MLFFGVCSIDKAVVKIDAFVSSHSSMNVRVIPGHVHSSNVNKSSIRYIWRATMSFNYFPIQIVSNEKLG